MWFSNRFNPTTDLSDLSRKVIIVTGANTGIGYTTVKHLARKGAKVYLGSRSKEKGNQAVEDLEKEGILPGKVIRFWCNIGTLQSAKKSAEEFLELEDRLDVLINNGASAGKVYGDPETPSEDGITEPSMIKWVQSSVYEPEVLTQRTTLFSHFGTVLFTKVLLPLLQKTAERPESDVRIITLTSNLHTFWLGRNPIVNSKTLDEFKRTHDDVMFAWMARYSTSKLANVVYARALQRRLSSTNIICMTVHPGLVKTSNYTRFRFQTLTGFVFWLIGLSQDEGSYTSCIAAASPKVRESEELYKGAYLTPIGNISEPAPAALNENIQDDLWETTEKYLEEHGLLSDANLI